MSIIVSKKNPSYKWGIHFDIIIMRGAEQMTTYKDLVIEIENKIDTILSQYSVPISQYGNVDFEKLKTVLKIHGLKDALIRLT